MNLDDMSVNEFTEMGHLKSISMEVSLMDVDPEVLGLMTGQKIVNGVFTAGPPSPMSMEFQAPIKRTFWQWLTRKPRRYRYIYMPHVRVTSVDGYSVSKGDWKAYPDA